MRSFTSRALVLASLVSLTFARASAQNESAPDASRLRPPAFLVRPDPEKPSLPLRVASAKASVVVAAGVATTTLDLAFQSDLDRVLEGELVLPLLPGATVSSFALEVGGKLREASVVEREKGRAVFEEVERRRVDPGLVEWVRGNVFRTRVYPIPMKGTYKVQVDYYGNQQQVIAGDTTIQVTVIKNYGRKNEERRSVTRRLKEWRECLDVAEVAFEK